MQSSLQNPAAMILSQQQGNSLALSDIEIAQAATLKPILQLAQDRLGIPAQALEPYGHYKAKIDLAWLNQQTGPDGKLVLVTAISPTPAGEGKTTTVVGPV